MTKIHIKTYGCSTNFSESEVMAGLLQESGFDIVDDIEDSYIVIINSCTVKGNTNIIRNLRKTAEEYPHKLIILAGCITSDLLAEAKEIRPELSSINTHNITEIVSVVEETLNGDFIDVLEKPEKFITKINLPKKRKNPVVSIIPISSGCKSVCSYCSVRIIKGELFSYPIESIVSEAEKSVKEGCREIWITSQDTACYGMEWDNKSHLPELLKRVLAIEGSFMVRLGMGNPWHFMLIADEIIHIMKNNKMFKFIHIPMQSGSDEILADMNRNYTLSQYLALVDKFRKSIPDITVSTDIICGFPGETENQFKESVRAIEKIQPEILNISRYQPRPGTYASSLKQIAGGVIKDRSRFITTQFDWIAFDRNRKWRAWEGTILIDEKGKNDTWVGRNSCYKPVIVSGDYKLGDIVKVKIKDITKYDLRA